ncbi:MAG TPA: VWA domain-containing protein [Bryobacteraceae bacterium]
MRKLSRWLLLLAVTAAGQQAPPPAPEAPTFRAGIKLVQVDVIARDKRGPAAGLTKNDFTIFDNGRQQEIAVFSAKSSVRSQQAAAVLPPGIVSNRVNSEGQTPGQGTIVLLDQKNTPVLPNDLQAYAISEIARFVERRRKQDRIGIYTLTREGLVAVQDLTDNSELLTRAVKSLKPQMPAYRDCQDVGLECALTLLTERALETKRSFQAIARHLASVPGRKTLVWVSASFPLRSRYFDFTPDMQEAARALNDANVALYSLDARGLIAAGRGIYPPGFETMDLVSEATGGEVFFNTNGIQESIEEAVEDGDVVYTLGFYPLQEEQDGVSHKLKVEVARKGVIVRYRETYVAAGIQTAAIAPETVEQLLKDSLDATQIELAARAEADPAQAGSYKVQVSVNLHDVQFQHQGTSWLAELGIGFYVKGTEGFRVITRKFDFPEKVFAAAVDKGTLIDTSIAFAGPKGVLRIVVQDHATGAAGSVGVLLGKGWP